MRRLEDLDAVFERGINAWENGIVRRHANRMGLKVVKLVKKKTPWKTGNLRRRWRARLERENGKITIWIENDAEYAAAVNNGHRVVRARRTVGFRQGKYMLEQGIQIYKEEQMKEDVEAMLEELRGALR